MEKVKQVATVQVARTASQMPLQIRLGISTADKSGHAKYDPQKCPFVVRPTHNTAPWAPRVHIQNGTSIGSSDLAGLTLVAYTDT